MAAAAAVIYRARRNMAVHAGFSLPPMSLVLSLIPGSRVDISLDSPACDTTAAPSAPRPQEVGTSELPSSLPKRRTTHQAAVWRDKPALHQEFGGRFCEGPARTGPPGTSASSTLPMLRTSHQPPYHKLGGGNFYTTSTEGVSTPAVITVMGSPNCDLDESDPYVRFDIYMKNEPAFELIQGHPLVEDHFMARMWKPKSQKVLKNLLSLHRSNCEHNVCVAASFFPENVLVAVNSSRVKLIIPHGCLIDGVHLFTSDGMAKAVDMYFTEVKNNPPQGTKNQPFTMPLDVKEFMRKVQMLSKMMTTKEQIEEILFDAALLDDQGITAALYKSSILLRGCYLYSNLECDIVVRMDSLQAVRDCPCQDGTDFVTYVGSNIVPITKHFHDETRRRSQRHRSLHLQAPSKKQSVLLRIQDGHDQIDALRNTVVHLNDPENLLRFQKYFTPTPKQLIAIGRQEQLTDHTVQQQIIGSQKQQIIPNAQQQIINPSGLQKVNNPSSQGLQQLINPAPQQTGVQQVTNPSQQAKILRTLQHDPYAPALITVSSNAIGKYTRFHFPRTTGVIFDSMRATPKSREDMDIPGLFSSDKKPET